MKNLHFVAIAAAALMAASVPASAQLSLVTSRAAFPVYDSVSWALLGPPFTTISSPFTIATADGSTVTVSHNAGTLFERRNQSTGGWFGNFSSGDALLWNRGNNGTVTFDPAELVSGAGFNVQSDFPGPFAFRLDAYDSYGGLLGSVTESGVANSIVGSAIFIGFTSPLINVDKFVGTLVQSQNGPSDFAINGLLLAGAGGSDSFVPVPEASTYGLMGAVAIFGCVGHRRFRLQRAV